jgi:hypothetical protein
MNPVVLRPPKLPLLGWRFDDEQVDADVRHLPLLRSRSS